MNTRKIAAIYSIFIGSAMIGMWLSLIATNQVIEINSEPIRITYNLIGEFLSAILLLICGFGLFINRGWNISSSFWFLINKSENVIENGKNS